MENKGISGLGNLGNTCFMNTTLQLFSQTPELYRIIDTFIQENKDKVNENQAQNDVSQSNLNLRLLKEWYDLRNLMWSKNCIINPGGWVRAVQVVAKAKNLDIFTGFAQNDLPEFMFFMLDTFHEAMKRQVKMNISGTCKNNKDKLAVACYESIKEFYSKEYSNLIDDFFGVQVTQLLPLKDKDETNSNEPLSIKPEPFMLCNLPLTFENGKRNQCSLKECFDAFIEEEILEGDNAWFNEKTNEKQSVRKKTTFWSLPEILIVVLKRFNNMGRKIQMKVDVPLKDLDLSSYVDGYNKASYVYDLYGVANHTGGGMGGHYYAFINVDGVGWVNFDDTRVSPISPKDVESGKLITPHAYVLFYRKKKS